MEETSTFLRHTTCEKCGSSDANSLFSDGHLFCFACGTYVAGEGATPTEAPKRSSGLLDSRPLDLGIPSRKITGETCSHFGYGEGYYSRQTVHVAPYYDSHGTLIAQHIRTRDKKFPWVGKPEEALPFGSQCWPKTGKMLVVTEGEIDALAMSQVQGNKWPVVSIGCGAGPQIKKYIGRNLDYFSGFEKVILMFDADEHGREATQAAAEVLGSRAHIAELPLKDASDMLKEGRVQDLIQAMWRAKQWTPQGIVNITSLKERVLQQVPEGIPWPWPTLTKWTYGIRPREIIAIGAATAAGKTDFLLQLASYLSGEVGKSVGLFFLEQAPWETALRLAGKRTRQLLHVIRNPEAIAEAWKTIEASPGQVFLYDSYGISDWEDIKSRMRYLAHSEGVRFFVLDHITALAAAQEDERKQLDVMMAEMAGLMQELDATLFLVSHLATPAKGSHEEGAQIQLREFRGSRAIGFWVSYAFGLERNQQAESETERATTVLRCLKDRWTGQATGRTLPLFYNHIDGMLEEFASHSSPDPAPTGEEKADF